MEASIKWQEPTILKLVATYNNLCGGLQSMIWLHKALPGAIAPHPIPSKGIFQLDVDSDIWQDVGLEKPYASPPQWLADEGVCKGIKLMLEIDRCNEEERQLSREQSVLQVWFAMEWLSVQNALKNIGEHNHCMWHYLTIIWDQCYMYALEIHKKSLVEVYVNLEAKVWQDLKVENRL